MNKLRKILEFIMALLGFLLNLKKKKPDEKSKTPEVPFPEGIGVVSGRTGPHGPVGGPFRGGTGVYRSPLDTLGVRTAGGATRDDTTATGQQEEAPTGRPVLFVGWALFAYAMALSLWGSWTVAGG